MLRLLCLAFYNIEVPDTFRPKKIEAGGPHVPRPRAMNLQVHTFSNKCMIFLNEKSRTPTIICHQIKVTFMARGPNPEYRSLRGHYTIGDLVNRLGACYATVASYVRRGMLPAPTHRHGGRNYYVADDLDRIAMIWEDKAGHLNKKQMAEELGISIYELNYRLRIGNLPEPQTQIGKRWYYSPDEAKVIKKDLAKK
jgi:DNA-binding transcriptional MerR regulator